MKKILAVSGGVDSMVLLDIFKNDADILVAHFNHGTRASADEDEAFVRRRCEELGVDVVVGHAKLGEKSSEEEARKARYDFLFSIREDVKKRLPNEPVFIYTAHHLDDLVESVFINLSRGTGWRGLTPFTMPQVSRPFLNGDLLLPESRADILTYAARNKITFRADPTNSSEQFLRNRIRAKLETLEPETHFQLNQKIKALYFSQQLKRVEIEKVLTELLPKDGVFKRSWFLKLEDRLACEILKFAFLKHEIKLTGPQVKDFLKAVREYAPEKKFNLPKDKLITLHKDWFKI